MGVPPKRNPYTMEVDRGINCYACGGFGHMVYHYRNRRRYRNWGRDRVKQERRLEYGGGRFEGNYKHLDNLKGVENLESLN